MIRLPVSRLKDGMITAQSIYNHKGANYLSRGTALNRQYIDRLKKIGISNVIVTSQDPSLPLPPPEDIIKEETRVNAIHQVFDTYTRLQQNQEMEIPPLLEASENIITDLLQRPENLVQMTDIRLYDDYTFAHCVNVAALSAMLGMVCHFSKQDLITITTGGLLHDLGKMDVAKSILCKTISLNDEEFRIIRQHPQFGYRRLLAMTGDGLDMKVIADIAYQHHEHIDGHGYPNHLIGNQISEFAKVVSIADVYDALTTQRPYKKAYSPHIAYTIMTKCSGKQFDEHLLKLFFDHVALYPTGTVLKTICGYGIVRTVHIGMTRFPQLIIFADNNKRLLKAPVTIETADQQEEFISSIVEGSELIALCNHISFDPSLLLIRE